MTLNQSNIFRFFSIAVLLMGVMLSVAHAEDDDDDGGRATANNAAWKTECSSCHVAYPPRFLTAESWHAIMSGLDKHFGSNASLDAATTKEIATFLDKNAGSNRHAPSGKPVLRITETRWFQHEHDEVADRVWKNPKVKSPANCAACHIQADSGNFSEHNIRIPK